MEAEINLDLIYEVAERTKFSSLLIEKDYYLTKFLQDLSKRQIKHLVFKGGTCLNKCYLGFYRLSEDLDFVYNKNLIKQSNTQIKKLVDALRDSIKNAGYNSDLTYNAKLGTDWKMITKNNRILGLVVYLEYISKVSASTEQIKVEISFRNKLRLKTENRKIHHEFVDSLGEYILPQDINIECISLKENLAEKFRALYTRKNIAPRDIYDIWVILQSHQNLFDYELIDLIVKKINESNLITLNDFIEFIKDLHNRKDKINFLELDMVLQTGLAYSQKEIISEIQTHIINIIRSKSGKPL